MSTDRPETQADAEADLEGLIFGELVSMKPRLFLWQDVRLRALVWLVLAHVTSVSLFGATLDVRTADRTFQTDDPDTIARFFEEWDVV